MNSCQFVGRLTRNPESKMIGETNLTKFGIAVNSRRKNKDGEWEEEPMFLDCELWGGLSSMVTNHFYKGDPIALSGELKLDQWEDKNDGKKRSKHYLKVDKVNFVPGKNGGDNANTTNAPSGTTKPRGRPRTTTTVVQEEPSNPENIPF